MTPLPSQERQRKVNQEHTCHASEANIKEDRQNTEENMEEGRILSLPPNNTKIASSAKSCKQRTRPRDKRTISTLQRPDMPPLARGNHRPAAGRGTETGHPSDTNEDIKETNMQASVRRGEDDETERRLKVVAVVDDVILEKSLQRRPGLLREKLLRLAPPTDLQDAHIGRGEQPPVSLLLVPVLRVQSASESEGKSEGVGVGETEGVENIEAEVHDEELPSPQTTEGCCTPLKDSQSSMYQFPLLCIVLTEL